MEKRLTLPLDPACLAELRTGDTVYLSGMVVTGRDAVHERALVEGRPLPAELAGFLRGGAVFHAGPIVRPGPIVRRYPPAEPLDSAHEELQDPAEQPPEWEMISVGPTTSMRMESCEAEFLELSGARLMIGKGGMGPKTAQACRRLGAIHTVFPGGCAVLAASLVEKIETVHWLDLGMAEAAWVLRVRDFGPLIVSIDSTGNNLFEKNKLLYEERLKTAVLGGF